MISVAIVSNFLSLHQMEISRAFISRNDVNFTFISSYGPSGFKKSITHFNSEFLPFVIRAYDNKNSFNEAQKIAEGADLVIFGSGDPRLIKNRDKIIFRYSEHFSRNTLLFPLKALHIHFLYRKEAKNGYLLCSSSHAKNDFNFAGLYPKRCLYYGYFPEVSEENLTKDKIFLKDETCKILWVGRGVRLKHPEIPFKLAKALFFKGIKYTITICSSDSKLIEKLKQSIKKKPYFKYFTFVPLLDHSKVLSLMRDSDVFLFTSDRREGWGAVLNEAMSSRCCCFANSSPGSTEFLIQNGVNGFIYKTFFDLKRKIVVALKNKDTLSSVANEAVYTINKIWNAQNAVSNILSLFSAISQQATIPDNLINNGPGTLIK